MKILLIEDEPGLVRMMTLGLSEHGHQVLTAETGEDGLLFARTEQIDVVLLDIMLPGIDGYQVLQGLRRIRSDMRIIMLTARDELRSKLTALDGGADDYITKPFAFEELLARIRALTRRSDQAQASLIACGGIRIDLISRRVWRDDQPVNLSRREFTLLEYFAQNEGRLLTRQQILTGVWEYDFEGESNVVDVYVGYLRNKLDRPGEPSLFTTVRGSGYRFDPARRPS